MSDTIQTALADPAPPLPSVMVIDDDRIDQMMYTRVLQRSGYFSHITSHRSAEDALCQLREEQGARPDLILLDINMPRMNGFEFLDAARADLPAGIVDVVIVMLTTSLDPRDTARAANYEEIRAYLNKPLTASHVQDLVTGHLSPMIEHAVTAPEEDRPRIH